MGNWLRALIALFVLCVLGTTAANAATVAEINACKGEVLKANHLTEKSARRMRAERLYSIDGTMMHATLRGPWGMCEAHLDSAAKPAMTYARFEVPNIEFAPDFVAKAYDAAINAALARSKPVFLHNAPAPAERNSAAVAQDQTVTVEKLPIVLGIAALILLLVFVFTRRPSKPDATKIGIQNEDLPISDATLERAMSMRTETRNEDELPPVLDDSETEIVSEDIRRAIDGLPFEPEPEPDPPDGDRTFDEGPPEVVAETESTSTRPGLRLAFSKAMQRSGPDAVAEPAQSSRVEDPYIGGEYEVIVRFPDSGGEFESIFKIAEPRPYGKKGIEYFASSPWALDQKVSLFLLQDGIAKFNDYAVRMHFLSTHPDEWYKETGYKGPPVIKLKDDPDTATASKTAIG